MTIIAGLLALFNGFTALLGETSSDLSDIVIDLNRYSMCATMIMAFGALAIMGGISAIRGKNISLALAGAALGMLGGRDRGILAWTHCHLVSLLIGRGFLTRATLASPPDK